MQFVRFTQIEQESGNDVVYFKHNINVHVSIKTKFKKVHYLYYFLSDLFLSVWTHQSRSCFQEHDLVYAKTNVACRITFWILTFQYSLNHHILLQPRLQLKKVKSKLKFKIKLNCLLNLHIITKISYQESIVHDILL